MTGGKLQGTAALPSSERRGLGRRDALALVLLAAWAVAALAFASWRTPYDDEWLSIQFAGAADAERFELALRGDLHPPWLALLDRALLSLPLEDGVLHLPRVLVSMLAVWLVASLLARRLRLPRWALVLCALHPIVFFYAGAIRWYPVVFFAQALRAWALWGGRPGDPEGRRSAAFLAGAALGPAAGYIDLLFVAHDSVWWLARGRTRARALGRALAAGAAAALAVLSPWLLFRAVPLFERAAGALPTALAPAAAAKWLALGLAGEAHPGVPWIVFAVLPLAGVACGLWTVRTAARPGGFGAWVALTALLWLLATALGVDHPRYSLMLWMMAAAALVSLFARGWAHRALALPAAAYLALVLALTVAGHGFFKSDLNRLPASACELLPVRETRLVVPYARLAEELRRTCGGSRPLTTVPTARLYPDDPEAHLAPLRRALRGARRVTVIDRTRGSGSWRLRRDRIRAHLAERCEPVETSRAAPVPHRALKARLQPRDQPAFRFAAETWRCAGP